MFPMVVWVLHICFRLTDNGLIVPDYSGITVGEPSKLRLGMMEKHGLPVFVKKKKNRKSITCTWKLLFLFKKVNFYINPKGMQLETLTGGSGALNG